MLVIDESKCDYPTTSSVGVLAPNTVNYRLKEEDKWLLGALVDFILEKDTR